MQPLSLSMHSFRFVLTTTTPHYSEVTENSEPGRTDSNKRRAVIISQRFLLIYIGEELKRELCINC